jgi:hypothetical protein
LAWPPRNRRCGLTPGSLHPEQIYERGEFELTRNRDDDAAYYFEIERLYPIRSGPSAR